MTLVADLLKYLIEFSRDYFKNYIAFLSQRLLSSTERESIVQNTSKDQSPFGKTISFSKENAKVTNFSITNSITQKKQNNKPTEDNVIVSGNTDAAQILNDGLKIKNASLFQNYKIQQSQEYWKHRSKSQINSQQQYYQQQQQQLESQNQIDQSNQTVRQQIKKQEQCASSLKLNWKPKEPSFPVTLQIKQQNFLDLKEQSIGQKSGLSLYDGLCDIEIPFLGLVMEGKLRRAKGEIIELKNLSEQLLDSSKFRNIQVQGTIQNYYEKYKFKYPPEIKQYERDLMLQQENQRREEDRQSKKFLQYYYQIIGQESTLQKSQQIQSKYQPAQQQQSQQQAQQSQTKSLSPLKNSKCNNNSLNAQMKILKVKNNKDSCGLLFPPNQSKQFSNGVSVSTIPFEASIQTTSSISQQNSFSNGKSNKDTQNMHNSPSLQALNAYCMNNQKTSAASTITQRFITEEHKINRKYKQIDNSCLLQKLQSSESFIQQQNNIRNNRLIRPPSYSEKNKRKEVDMINNYAIMKRTKDDLNSLKSDQQWLSIIDNPSQLLYTEEQFNENGQVMKTIWKKYKGMSGLRLNSQADFEAQKQENDKPDLLKSNQECETKNNDDLGQEPIDNIENSTSAKSKINSVWQNWWAVRQRQERRSRSLFQSYQGYHSIKHNGAQQTQPNDSQPQQSQQINQQNQQLSSQLPYQSTIQSLLNKEQVPNQSTDEKYMINSKPARSLSNSRAQNRNGSLNNINSHSNLFSKQVFQNRVNLSELSESMANSNTNTINNNNINQNFIQFKGINACVSNQNNLNQQQFPPDFYYPSDQNRQSSQIQPPKQQISLTTRFKREENIRNCSKNRANNSNNNSNNNNQILESNKSHNSVNLSSNIPSYVQKLKQKQQRGAASFALVLMKQRERGNFAIKMPPQNLPNSQNNKKTSKTEQQQTTQISIISLQASQPNKLENLILQQISGI